MTKEDFERGITGLLPDVSDQAMKNWLEYAKNLGRDGTETKSEILGRSSVELALIKRRQGMETVTAPFNYGEKFVSNYFELRDAAELLEEDWPLERISDHAVENGCDPTLGTMEESHAALEESQSGKWDIRGNRRKFGSDLFQGTRQSYALEQGLGDQDGTFNKWTRAAYEINKDFDQSFAEIASGLCGALHNTDAQYGRDINRQPYNTLAMVLPMGIRNVAQYLGLDGSLDHVLAPALAGLLMELRNHGSMLQTVKHMNDGRDVASAYYAAEGEVFEDHSPQCQQTI